MHEFLTVLLIAALNWLSGFFMAKHLAKIKYTRPEFSNNGQFNTGGET